MQTQLLVLMSVVALSCAAPQSFYSHRTISQSAKYERLNSKSFSRPTPDDIEFRLYTKESTNNPDRLVPGNLTLLEASKFKSDLPLVVVTHGFSETADDSVWMNATKNALLEKADMNVILTQWQELANGIRYDIAARNTYYVGIAMAELLQFVENNTEGFSGSSVHLVGFSLGAHVSGIAGHKYPGVARITGLDPAGPLFEDGDPESRLDASDADLVDVIHTNAGYLLTGHFGYNEPVGHLDFYVNGGSSQFGCPPFIWDSIVEIITLSPGDIDACSHGRAHEYFLESITSPEPSFGFQCLDYESFEVGNCFDTPRAALGYDVTRNATGVFYVDTQGELPFFSRRVEVNLTIGEGENTYHGELTFHTNLPGRETKEVVMFSGWPSLHPGDLHKTALTIPSGTNLDELTIDVVFHKNYLLPLSPNHLNVEAIVAVDAHTEQEFCLASKKVFKSGTSYSLKATLGSC
ncbi:inactive pancreatic lipase-related protein 1-like [Penaeus japonicus]|uniref:inactive pancreatic lipase-related protein 1-like n=1 Tax=Penaeus japonicus TaxID=27405 RepID=UPI001C717A7C|nr:inactive pancreatic lipase-related protein 1-like [Penaeus japonicus]